jgi:DnaK suppressor protein
MMKRKDLTHKLAQILVRRRAALRKTLGDHTSMIAVNDRPVGDTVDAALDCEQDELDSQLATVESRELAAIDAALERLREGRYGNCEGCGKSIPAVRLQTLPYATMCIACQRQDEHAHGRGFSSERGRTPGASMPAAPSRTARRAQITASVK